MVWVLKKSWFWSQLCSGQKFQKVEKNVRNWRPSGQADWKVERLWKEKLLSSNRLTTFLFRVVQFFNLLGRQFRTRVEIFSLMQALCYEILLHWLKCGKIRTHQTKVFSGSERSSQLTPIIRVPVRFTLHTLSDIWVIFQCQFAVWKCWKGLYLLME